MPNALLAEIRFRDFVITNNSDLLLHKNRTLYDELLKRYIVCFNAGDYVGCSIDKINQKFMKGIFYGWQNFVRGEDY